jgi:hypothetical protein
MATVTLTANGAAVEVVAAAAVRAIVQNISTSSCVILNAADPAEGLILRPGESFDIGKVSAWTAAWTGKALDGKAVNLRVASE